MPDERPRARIESRHFRRRRAHRRRRPAAELLELSGEGLGERGILLVPGRGLADEHLEVVHRASRKLLRGHVPLAPPFAQPARERLEPHRGARDRLLAGHQRAAA